MVVASGSWFDWVQIVVGTVSMVAALAAVFFAFETVRETRVLRREDRVDDLLDLVAEYGQLAVQSFGISPGDERSIRRPVVRAHLRAAIDSTGEDLPACERLLTTDGPGAPAVQSATAEALNEVAAVLTRLRDEGSFVGRRLRR
jgi:hypothetical protein